MTLRCCDGVRLGQPCRTLFAVGLHNCPHCKSTDHHEFGSRPEDEEHPQMPKIGRSIGATSRPLPVETGDGPGSPDVEATAPDAPVRPTARDDKPTWATYAEHLELDVTGLTKAQIIEAVEDHETAPVVVDETADEADEPADGEDASTDDDE